MDKQSILELLQNVAKGELSPDAAYTKLRISPFEDLGYAKVDHHRAIRQGVPEVIFGERKTPEQIIGIVRAMQGSGAESILITRLPESSAEIVGGQFNMSYDRLSRVAVVDPVKREGLGCVVVASGGTSDLPVCEEAALTAEALGSRVVRLYDVGVAGIHRLLSNIQVVYDARVIIAVAGMEGALASVVAGLADCPVIAVPTSVGYGASFGGLAALLSMLNSCASGVSVVNIDNGFGAGYLANMINLAEGVKR